MRCGYYITHTFTFLLHFSGKKRSASEFQDHNVSGERWSWTSATTVEITLQRDQHAADFRKTSSPILTVSCTNLQYKSESVTQSI